MQSWWICKENQILPQKLEKGDRDISETWKEYQKKEL
jgi:hypothetical protein